MLCTYARHTVVLLYGCCCPRHRFMISMISADTSTKEMKRGVNRGGFCLKLVFSDCQHASLLPCVHEE